MAANTALPRYAAIPSLTITSSPHSGDSEENKKSRFCSWPLILPPKWKKGLWWDFGMTLVIFIGHITFLLAAQLKHREPGTNFWGSYGFAVFSKTTDCNQLSHQRTGWSLVVNILAALISIFSSATLQALSAPTRKQLDKCHKDGDYMEIGIQSFHNIIKPYLGWAKRSLWVMLMLMSLPFHILYNSVIVLSIPATESYQVTLSDTFFNLNRNTVHAIPNLSSSTGTPTSTVTSIRTVTRTPTEIPTSAPTGPLCPTSSTLRVLSELPPEALRQFTDIDETCNLWVVACQKDLPCGEFVREVRQLVPGYSMDKFFAWNPDVKDDQSCSGFWQNYTYCAGQRIDADRSISREPNRIDRSARSALRPYPRNEGTKTINLTAVNRLHGIDVDTNKGPEYISSAYEMSPFIAWSRNISVNASDPSKWPGLDTVSNDLDSLLANTNTSIHSDSIWESLVVSSPDWQLLSLDECLGAFSIRYRPNAGTVVLVVSGGGSSTSDNFVLGLNYLSYLTQSLGVVCPDYFINRTPGGQDLIDEEDPPTLPLIFGTFGQEKSFRKSNSVIFTKGNLCPTSYAGVEYDPSDIPAVKGCALRVRGSKCRLGYNVIFFIIVSAALAIKLVLLLLALLIVRERPILTVGDAIAEYLENEDPSTVGCSLEWTRACGLQCTGPMQTYDSQTQGSSQSKEQSQTIRRHRWREIWPSKGDARSSDVPRWDILNYSAAMKSWERAWWLMLHIFTLGVSAGVFTSIFLQSGWMVYPSTVMDKYWMLWPCVLVNLPQLFATFRGFADTKIMTSRNSLQEFANYATAAQGLRVSDAKKGTEQRDSYFFGNMNGLVYVTLTGLQVLYTFILSQLVIPQWINPLNPGEDDGYFSPAFLMRFGSQERRSWIHTSIIIVFIIIFPFVGVHVVNTVSSFVVRVRLLKISDLSTFIPQYIFDIFFIPSKCRPGKGDFIETTHLLPLIPLQMPGPATNSLVLSVACHPNPSEADTRMSRKRLRWGVVLRPSPSIEAHSPQTPLTKTQNTNQDELLSSPSSISDPQHVREKATLSPFRPGETLRRESTAASIFTMKRNAPRYSQIMEVQEESNQDDFISFSPTHDEPLSPPEKTPCLTQRPEETLRRSSTAKSTFSIKRKAVPSVHVIELHSESAETSSCEEVKDKVGHCSFSAEPVDELEPGKLYTGIRRDENHTMWLQGGSTSLKRTLMDVQVRLRPRRKAGDRMMSAPRMTGYGNMRYTP